MSTGSGHDAYSAQLRHGKVVHSLGRRIVRGSLLPGVSIPVEADMADELGLGRSAVRDGMKVLAGKGLLESRTSAGTVVRPRQSWNLLDPDVLRWRFSEPVGASDLRIIADLRVALEPGAARLAAESRSADGLRQVEEALAALWANTHDVDAFVEADLAFHRAVFIASGNDLLLYVHDMVGVAMGEVRSIHSQSMQHNVETLPVHERVAMAIRRRHHKKAEEAMREVVEVARRDINAIAIEKENN